MSHVKWIYGDGIQKIYKIKQMECTGYMISRIQGKGII